MSRIGWNAHEFVHEISHFICRHRCCYCYCHVIFCTEHYHQQQNGRKSRSTSLPSIHPYTTYVVRLFPLWTWNEIDVIPVADNRISCTSRTTHRPRCCTIYFYFFSEEKKTEKKTFSSFSCVAFGSILTPLSYSINFGENVINKMTFYYGWILNMCVASAWTAKLDACGV